MTLVDHAHTALSQTGDTARDYWRSSLSRIDENHVRMLSRLPVMSEVARRFAVHVLISNRRRLLMIIGQSRPRSPQAPGSRPQTGCWSPGRIRTLAGSPWSAS